MNTLESKLRIAHQIQVAAIKKGMGCGINAFDKSFSIALNDKEGGLVEIVWCWDKTEQELLDWWEAIAK
ncbi:MAG: hypothetical protein ACPG5V_14410 [Vibrio cyclitrophicus]